MFNLRSIINGYSNLGLFLWISCASNLVKDVDADFSYETITTVLSRISIAYTDPLTKTPRSFTAEIGRFASNTVRPAGGLLVAAIPPSDHPNPRYYSQGCSSSWSTAPNATPWIALLERGGCSDVEKVRFAVSQNASAVLIFGNDHESYFRKDPEFEGNIVVVYLLQSKGDQLTALLKKGIAIYLSIGIGQEVKFRITSINRTSILFVSVSFMVLMVISLAWLVFYYIQRFRYLNAKDKLAKHLNIAAKKALSKIPLRTIKSGDLVVTEYESCAVCIETFQVSDHLRSLPCKHEFHKNCVDSWLLEHRTCPMCKMDILKYYGYSPCDNSKSDSNNDIVVVESGHGSRSGVGLRGVTSSPQGESDLDVQVSVIGCSDVVESDEMSNNSSPRNLTNSSLRPTSSRNVTNDAVLPIQTPPSSQNQSRTASSIIRSLISPSSSQVAPQNVINSNLYPIETINNSPSHTEASRTSNNGDLEHNNDEANIISISNECETEKDRSISSISVKSDSQEDSRNRSRSYEVNPLDFSDENTLTSVITDKVQEANSYAFDSQKSTSNGTSTEIPTVGVFKDGLQDNSTNTDQIYGISSSSQSNSQFSRPSSDYDLERLVREIDELEREQNISELPDVPMVNYNNSDIISPKKRGSITPIMENRPQSSISPELTEIECNPPLQVTLGTDIRDASVRRASTNNTRISTTDLDDDDGGNSNSNRRSSSHIITINHS